MSRLMCSHTRCGRLTILDLSDNILGDNVMTAISNALGENTILKELSLNRCKLREKGENALRDALIKNSTLQSLSLSELTDYTVQILHPICIGVAANVGIAAFNLSKNNIQDSGAVYVADMIGKNIKLSDFDVQSCGFTQEGELIRISHVR